MLSQFLLFEKIVEIPEVVDIPVVTQRLILMVQTVLLTVEIPQFVDTVADVPVVRSYWFSRAGRRHSCRDAEADPHGPSDH